MPHECVSCGEVFEDGADEVFDGCPDCGATKFFYVKEIEENHEEEDASVSEAVTETETTPTQDPPDPDETETETPVRTRRKNTVSEGEDDIVEAESEYDESFGGKLGSDDTSDETDETKPETQTVESPEGRKFRRARADEARRRLMDQFETIRIVEPGSYELNLMNLYEEDEKIIALQEDGRYQVSLPSTLDD